ncbi:unnamed protein product [Trichogramma brassicae]|uniref:Uncharacterized protein n=1 Tax=Trichogramma brassicae TaxID=86971 RepID=A0A6H5IWT1_9HYME|nr:unnamed protein product [Trichogramma brassicae]
MDWEESVQPGNYSWQRPAWQQRTGRRQKKSFPSASTGQRRWHAPAYSIAGRGTSPERRRRAAVGGGDTGNAGAAGGGPSTGGEWDGEAFEEVFRGSLKRKFCCWRRGEATATLRRSGETTEESARVPTPPLAPVQEPSALPLPPPVQQVSYVAGLHGLVFQPFAVQQQRLPQTEYPLDGQQQRQLRRPGPYQEQQQHRQLPRRQPQQHQREEEVRVEVRPLSPVGGPSSLSGNTAAPARIRGEKFGGLEPVGFVPGLDPPRGACFLSVTNLDTLAASTISRQTYIHVTASTCRCARVFGARSPRQSCAPRIHTFVRPDNCSGFTMSFCVRSETLRYISECRRMINLLPNRAIGLSSRSYL